MKPSLDVCGSRRRLTPVWHLSRGLSAIAWPKLNDVLEPPGNLFGRGRLAQLVEHFPYKEEVGGSSPSTPTINFHSGYRARLAPSRRRQIARPRFGPHLVRVRIDHSLVEVARGSHDRHLHRLSTTGHGHLNIRSDEVNPSAWSKKSATNLGRVTVEMKAPISRGPLSSFPPPLKPRSTELYVTSLTLELKRSLLEMLPPTARSLGVGCIWQASQQKAPTQERDQWRD